MQHHLPAQLDSLKRAALELCLWGGAEEKKGGRWGGRGAKCVEGTARELARRVGEHKVKGDQRACFPHDACV